MESEKGMLPRQTVEGGSEPDSVSPVPEDVDFHSLEGQRVKWKDGRQGTVQKIKPIAGEQFSYPMSGEVLSDSDSYEFYIFFDAFKDMDKEHVNCSIRYPVYPFSVRHFSFMDEDAEKCFDNIYTSMNEHRCKLLTQLFLNQKAKRRKGNQGGTVQEIWQEADKGSDFLEIEFLADRAGPGTQNVKDTKQMQNLHFVEQEIESCYQKILKEIDTHKKYEIIQSKQQDTNSLQKGKNKVTALGEPKQKVAPSNVPEGEIRSFNQECDEKDHDFDTFKAFYKKTMDGKDPWKKLFLRLWIISNRRNSPDYKTMFDNAVKYVGQVGAPEHIASILLTKLFDPYIILKAVLGNQPNGKELPPNWKKALELCFEKAVADHSEEPMDYWANLLSMYNLLDVSMLANISCSSEQRKRLIDTLRNVYRAKADEQRFINLAIRVSKTDATWNVQEPWRNAAVDSLCMIEIEKDLYPVAKKVAEDIGFRGSLTALQTERLIEHFTKNLPPEKFFSLAGPLVPEDENGIWLKALMDQFLQSSEDFTKNEKLFQAQRFWSHLNEEQTEALLQHFPHTPPKGSFYMIDHFAENLPLEKYFSLASPLIPEDKTGVWLNSLMNRFLQSSEDFTRNKKLCQDQRFWFHLNEEQTKELIQHFHRTLPDNSFYYLTSSLYHALRRMKGSNQNLSGITRLWRDAQIGEMLKTDGFLSEEEQEEYTQEQIEQKLARLLDELAMTLENLEEAQKAATLIYRRHTEDAASNTILNCIKKTREAVTCFSEMYLRGAISPLVSEAQFLSGSAFPFDSEKHRSENLSIEDGTLVRALSVGIQADGRVLCKAMVDLYESDTEENAWQSS